SISNLYNIKLANKTLERIPLTIKMENEAGNIEIIGNHNIIVKEEGQGSGSFFVVLPRSAIRERKKEIKLGLYQGNKKIDVVKTNFLGPIYN
ncbi:MAG TPA: FixG Ig-like domain-containing protein, partial [Chitinophagaceae bacterium]